MTKANVVLLSYRRPELTLAAIERVLSWPSLDSLMVSIDGLRENAPASENIWWTETRLIAEKYARENDKITLNFRSENSGLTNHVVQALSRAFETHDGVILLEEDVEIDAKGLDFLSSSVVEANRPQGASAFTRSEHLGTLPSGVRNTFFPELWGMSINREFFQHFEQLWKFKRLDRKKIQQSMRESFPNLRANRLETHVDWWITLFESALKHHTHQDALFAATAMELGSPWIVGWESMSRDVAWGDQRSLHPRVPGDDKTFRHYSDWTNAFCAKCERKHGRLTSSSLRRRIYERLYWASLGAIRARR